MSPIYRTVNEKTGTQEAGLFYYGWIDTTGRYVLT